MVEPLIAWAAVAPDGTLRPNVALRDTKKATELAVEVFVKTMSRDSFLTLTQSKWSVVQVRIEVVEDGK